MYKPQEKGLKSLLLDGRPNQVGIKSGTLTYNQLVIWSTCIITNWKPPKCISNQKPCQKNIKQQRPANTLPRFTVRLCIGPDSQQVIQRGIPVGYRLGLIHGQVRRFQGLVFGQVFVVGFLVFIERFLRFFVFITLIKS